MMKRNIVVYFCLGSLSFLLLMSCKSDLSFDDNHRFKIVQLTDIHWVHQSENEVRCLSVIEKVMSVENPDLVVITGDLFYSAYEKEGLNKIVEPMIKREIPWVLTLGNHDDEKTISRDEVIAYAMTLEYNKNEVSDTTVDGVGNMTLEISSSSRGACAAKLYLFDSNAYSLDSTSYYDWIKQSQIKWFVDEYAQTKTKYDKPIPSLCFFHIPLPEFLDVQASQDYKGHSLEDVSCPKYNSGLFAELVKATDVMGVFVGHDHNNDFIGVHDGVALAYGRMTGFDCYGDLPKGARVIRLYENKMGFDTWIRDAEGEKYLYHYRRKK